MKNSKTTVLPLCRTVEDDASRPPWYPSQAEWAKGASPYDWSNQIATIREEFAWFPKRSTYGSLIWMQSYIIYETWVTVRGVEKNCLLDTALYTQSQFVEAKLKGEVI